MFGILIIIVLLLLFLFFAGFINESRVPNLPKKICVKWDAVTDKCLEYNETKDSILNGLIRWE